jgi:hypothetical protein
MLPIDFHVLSGLFLRLLGLVLVVGVIVGLKDHGPSRDCQLKSPGWSPGNVTPKLLSAPSPGTLMRAALLGTLYSSLIFSGPPGA